MQHLCTLGDGTLLELNMCNLFPAPHTIHTTISRKEVLDEVVDRLGYTYVSEADIVAYAKQTRLDSNHWIFGNGRRFLMHPILKKDSKGELITYVGPYDDCGAHGYELGLWYAFKPEDPTKADFPRLARHPIAIAYSPLSTLVVKKAL